MAEVKYVSDATEKAPETIEKPELMVWVGPVRSGKSRTLESKLSIYAAMPRNKGKVLLICPEADSDVQGSAFATHSVAQIQPSTNGIVETVGKTLQDVDAFVAASNFAYIGIEEGHMFKDLKRYVAKWFFLQRRNVLVAGLDGSWCQCPIGDIAQVQSLATKAWKLEDALCVRCKVDCVAPYSIRLTDDKKTIVVEKKGKEGTIYEPVCFTHLLEHLRAKYATSKHRHLTFDEYVMRHLKVQ